MAAQDKTPPKNWYELTLPKSIMVLIGHLLIGTWYVSQIKTNFENQNNINKEQIFALQAAVKELTVAMKSVEIGLVKFESNVSSLNEIVEKQDRRIDRLEQKR